MPSPKKRKSATKVIGRDENGKYIRKYFYGKSKHEAEAKLEQWEKARAMGLDPDAEDMTVSEWIDIWYEQYKKPTLNPHYEANTMSSINRIKNTIGSLRIQTVREAHLQGLMFSLSDKSYSSIAKHSQILKQIFHRAYKNKIIPDDPSEDIVLPDGHVGTHRALEPWEVKHIVSHWQEHRAGLWVLLMLYTGIRRGEMIALDWSQINLDKKILTVDKTAVMVGNTTVISPITKTIAGMRRIPLSGVLLSALAIYPPHAPNAILGHSEHSQGYLTQSAFRRGIENYNLAMTRLLRGEPISRKGHRSDLDKSPPAKGPVFSIRAHDLRHTFATALFDAGVSVKAAQYYLGHADIKITLDLYTHLSKERENREQIQLSSFLDSWTESQKI